MSTSTMSRLVPTVSRLAATRVAVTRPSLAPRLCRWNSASKRTFSSRSPCKHATEVVVAEHLTDETCAVYVKKYTEDHEWIELDAEGKIGTNSP